MNITFTVPDAKLPRIIVAMKGWQPVPTDEDGDPQYTDAQWAKEVIRQWVIMEVVKHERHQATSDIQADDGLLS